MWNVPLLFPTFIAFFFAQVFSGFSLRVRKLRFLSNLGFMAVCSNNLYTLFHKSNEIFQHVQSEGLNFASLSSLYGQTMDKFSGMLHGNLWLVKRTYTDSLSH